MADTTDLVVIGGGPAGGLVAALVRQQDPDRRVVLLERGRFPRHHVGESSIPSWRPILERAGVREKVDAAIRTRKVGTIFWWGTSEDRTWTIDFRDTRTGGAPPASYQLDRSVFDQVLLDHAAELGAEVHQEATVTAVTPLGSGRHRVTWQAGDETHHLETDYVVDASGQARLLARLFRLPLVGFDDMNNFAVVGYWRGSKLAQYDWPVAEHERWTYIAASDDGWVWHIPLDGDLVSVGLVTDGDSLPKGGASELEAHYLRNVRACPPVAALLEDATLDRHPLAPQALTTVRDWSYHCEEACGPGWFVAGDAAVFVDPVLSSGMLLAANGASMAANALHTLWRDPAVDPALLRRSYTDTYRDMAGSYHRLARIWYARNFKASTWHWEAKRQRLMAGGRADAETDARAFLALCLGSFTNPLEAAIRGDRGDLLRPDARIYAGHLFADDVRDNPLYAVLDDATETGATETETRAAIRADTARQWQRMLHARPRLNHCTWETRESYVTDGYLDHWERVRLIEVRARAEDDAFGRVILPSPEVARDGVLPFLDGRRTLAEALEAAAADTPVGSQAYDELLEGLQYRIFQLDFRCWLDGVAEAPPAPTPEALPAPLEAVLRGETGGPAARLEIGLLGETATVRFEDDSAPWTLTRLDRSPEGYRYAASATTAFAYRGRDLAPEARARLDDLVAALRRLEASDPEGADGLWPRILGPRAGEVVAPAAAAELPDLTEPPPAVDGVG